MSDDQRIFVIYYDGRRFDLVQNKGRGYGRYRAPRRVYWTRGHAEAALRGIIDDQRPRSWRRKDEPVFGPAKFEIVEFRLERVTN